MHHSVPAPTLPPDSDDLYLPAPHLRAGRMASVVWSCMKLVSTNTDFAWCTVCRKWYRYRADFNAAYIKTLFKHCTTSHTLIDGKIRPISAANTQVSAPQTHQPVQSRPQPQQPPPVVQQPQQANPILSPFAQNQQQTQPNPTQTQPLSQSQPQLQPSLAQTQYISTLQEQAHQQQLQLLQRQIQRQRQAAALQQAQQIQAQQIQVQLQQAQLEQALRQPLQGQPSHSPISPAEMGRSAPQPHTRPPTQTTSAALLPSAQLFPVQPSTTAATPVPMQWTPSTSVPISQGNPLVQQIPPQQASVQAQRVLNETLQSPVTSQQPQQLRATTPMSTIQAQRIAPPQQRTTQATPQSATRPASQQMPQPTVQLSPQAPTEQNADVEMTPVDTPNSAPRNGPSAANTAAAQAKSTPTSTAPSPATPAGQGRSNQNTSGGIAAKGVPAQGTAAGSNRESQGQQAQPNGKNTAQNGRAQQKPVPPPSTPDRAYTRTKCEVTEHVRGVAERSQRLMFNAISLFFHKAVFKVPSSQEEALQVMRQGTEDVDKDGGPDSDLYILSWSHTQFFSAQMAALGYRFVSSNLKRRAGQTEPPPIEEWLELHKYEPVEPQPQRAAVPGPQAAGKAATPSAAAPPKVPQATTPSTANRGSAANPSKQVPSGAQLNGGIKQTPTRSPAKPAANANASTPSKPSTAAPVRKPAATTGRTDLPNTPTPGASSSVRPVTPNATSRPAATATVQKDAARKTPASAAQPAPTSTLAKAKQSVPPSSANAARSSDASRAAGASKTNLKTPAPVEQPAVKEEGVSVAPLPSTPAQAPSASNTPVPTKTTPSATAPQRSRSATSAQPSASAGPSTSAALQMNGITNQRSTAPNSSVKQQRASSTPSQTQKKKDIPVIDLT